MMTLQDKQEILGTLMGQYVRFIRQDEWGKAAVVLKSILKLKEDIEKDKYVHAEPKAKA